jgi:hypothetical protein
MISTDCLVGLLCLHVLYDRWHLLLIVLAQHMPIWRLSTNGLARSLLIDRVGSAALSYSVYLESALSKNHCCDDSACASTQ